LTDASDKLDIFLRHRADLIDYAAPIVGCRARRGRAAGSVAAVRGGAISGWRST
jgi:hypothetical protein